MNFKPSKEEQAALRHSIDAYARIAGFDISGNPGITATLYNLGDVKHRARQLRKKNEKRIAAGEARSALDGVPVDTGSGGSFRIRVSAGPHVLTFASVDAGSSRDSVGIRER